MHISKLHFRQLPGVRFTAALGLLSAAGAAPAAETVGNALPYEGWLQTLQQSLTGPVAFSVAMIGIVCCGATLIFAGGEIGRFMRSLVYLVLVMTMLIGANNLMSRFFNGASIGDIEPDPAAAAAVPEVQHAAFAPWAEKLDALLRMDDSMTLYDLPPVSARTGCPFTAAVSESLALPALQQSCWERSALV